MSEHFDMGYIAFGLNLSPDARNFFAKMTEDQRNAWQPRYQAICAIARGEQQYLPDMTWWEKEFLAAMTAPSDKANPIPTDENN